MLDSLDSSYHIPKNVKCKCKVCMKILNNGVSAYGCCGEYCCNDEYGYWCNDEEQGWLDPIVVEFDQNML